MGFLKHYISTDQESHSEYLNFTLYFLKLIVIIEETAKRKPSESQTKLNLMSLIKLLQQNIPETKQSILCWLSLSRQEKRSFNWQQKNIVLYPMLMPLFYEEINLDQLLISHQQLNDKFNKFFSSTFKLRTINWRSEQPFNLNEVFILNLNAEIVLSEVFKKNVKFMEKKISLIQANTVIKTWQTVQCLNNLVRLSSRQQGGGSEAKILYADKGLMGRFKIEILKQDYFIKSNFINNFLFCGTSPSYSISCITVQKLQRGQVIKGLDQKIYLLFQGSVIHFMNYKNSNKSSNILGQKWKFQLVRGSLICKNSIKTLLINQSQKINTFFPATQQQFVHSYQLLTDSVFITMSYTDLIKIIKSQNLIKKQLLEKIKQTQSVHDEFIRKSLNIEQKIRQQQNKPIEYHYSIPRNKKSKAFRKKAEKNAPFNYDQFITFDKFETMTLNKENVEKKHEVYSQLNNYLRQKQKQDRFMQKMNTEKGMKEFKKCEYQARLKQNKIQILAIKQSIFNAEKYRENSHEVKFIFEEQLMDRYLKCTKSSQKNKRNLKKLTSLVDFQNYETESKAYRTEQKPSFNQDLKKPPFLQESVSRIQNNKMVHFQSTPNLFANTANTVPGRKKMRIGSAVTPRFA